MRLDPRVKERLKQAFVSEITAQKKVLTVTSVYPLTEDERKTIASTFSQFEYGIVENVVDPALLGGFILTQGSKTIDLSVRSVLHTLQKTIS